MRRDRRLWALLGGVVLVVLLGAGVAVAGTLELLAVLRGGTTLFALAAAALPYLVALAVLGLVGLALGVWLVARLVKRASGDLNADRFRALAEWVVERGLARRLGLSRRF
ncbi:hypothetical protein [Halosegnis sp.]|uniref:hypothetical protein n=1 Tax=Halosegnis sp. TaxID=2864959 RepID=UPI0035D49E47